MCNPPMPCTEHRHISIGKLHGHGSLSIGTVTNGYVVNPAKLPLEGPTWHVMAEQAKRGTNFGTDEIINMLKQVSAKVEKRFPHSKMQVANIGACGGEGIPWSVSHRSGRDVDIAFYFIDDAGKPVTLSNMLNVEPDGTAVTKDGRTVYFDDARNWLMIRSILEDPDVSVQWIFIANYLKGRVLHYAKGHDAPQSILFKAAQAMWQPYGSSAHSDHIHVRIYCPKDDILEGCRDIGSNRPWYVEDTPMRDRRVTELLGILKHGQPTERRQAIRTLGAMRDPRGDQAIGALLDSQNPKTLNTVAKVLFRWGMPYDTAVRVLKALNRVKNGRTALYLLYALKRYHGNGRCALMCNLMDLNKNWRVKSGLGVWDLRAVSFACTELGLRGETLALPALMGHLAVSNLPDRKACLWAVRRITNRRLVFNPFQVDPHVLQATWMDWYDAHRQTTRMGFLVSGFAIKGVVSHEGANTMDFTNSGLLALYKRATGDYWDSYNAMFLLSRLLRVGLWVPRNSMHTRRYYFVRSVLKRLQDEGLRLYELFRHGLNGSGR